MSYNLPGQNSGFVRTEAPSPPCTGNFVERLDCSDYGFFFWVGAVCVIVVVCGLFSCCVVSPLLDWWKERREYIEYRNRSVRPTVPPPPHHHHHHHDSLDKTRPEANAENPPGRAPHRAKTPRKHRRPHNNNKVHGINSDEERKLEEASDAFTPTVRTKRQRSARSSRDLKASMGSNRGAERSSHERRGSQTRRGNE